MCETDLFTRSREYVATIELPTMVPPVEIVVWGARFFVRDDKGVYREGVVWFVPWATAPMSVPAVTDRAATLPAAIRDQVERAMADPERMMPSERAALERLGFKPAEAK